MVYNCGSNDIESLFFPATVSQFCSRYCVWPNGDEIRLSLDVVLRISALVET